MNRSSRSLNRSSRIVKVDVNFPPKPVASSAAKDFISQAFSLTVTLRPRRPMASPTAATATTPVQSATPRTSPSQDGSPIRDGRDRRIPTEVGRHDPDRPQSINQRTCSSRNMEGKRHRITLEGFFLLLIFLSSTTTLVSCCTMKSDDVGTHVALDCQLATHQGHRKYQEDRMLCAHEVHALGAEFKSTSVHIAAIFDGHNGAEASEMASKLLSKHFSQHVHSLFSGVCSMSPNKSNTSSLTYEKVSTVDFQYWPHLNTGQCPSESSVERESSSFLSRSVYKEILRKSILSTVDDIELAFSKDALTKNWKSGSTAVIVLMIDDEILVAHVGDSKAILCSESTYVPRDVRASLVSLRRRMAPKPMTFTKGDENLKPSDPKCFLVNELTKDHHPDIDVERKRVEAAGGYVEDCAGVPRVNGQLAVSRSIGDVHFKRYGVISTPDVTDWRHITGNDRYLVLGSDGIFEELTTQEVCNLLWIANFQSQRMPEESSATNNSLAEYIVDVAFKSGTTDNMSVIVISLGSNGQQNSSII